jgi:hypothetical protein
LLQMGSQSLCLTSSSGTLFPPPESETVLPWNFEFYARVEPQRGICTCQQLSSAGYLRQFRSLNQGLSGGLSGVQREQDNRTVPGYSLVTNFFPGQILV